MSRPEYDNLEAWQTNFVYEETGVRDQFWETVLMRALKILSDRSELYSAWLKGYQPSNSRRSNEVGGSQETSNESTKISHRRTTNGDIMRELSNLLLEPIRTFFAHPVTKECLRKTANKSTLNVTSPKVPFLFIIDEAAYLHQTNYMHSFMWVLDQPVVHILKNIFTPRIDSSGLSDMPTDRFFILMLGTHSRISHFAPDEILPSERVLGQLLPSPFLSFNLDVDVEPFRPPCKLRYSENLFELARWGWVMWHALFKERSLDAFQNRTSDALQRYMSYIKAKIQPESDTKLHRELSILAVMSLRLHLDVDCAAPTRASQLVCSKMRWLVDVGNFRKHVTTTYGSEPLLVEAAACMMNSYDEVNAIKVRCHGPPFTAYISELMLQLSQGYISRGNHGELTARLLCTYILLHN